MSVRRLVAVAAALLAVSACAGEPQESGGVSGTARPVVEAPAPAAGWRVETWHDLTLNVPDAFGYGAPSQWCIARPRALPRVMRPMDVHTLVGCRPGTGYGVMFLPADVLGPNVRSGRVWRYDGTERYPRGAWVAAVVKGRLAVQIVTAKRSVTEQISASVRRTEVDGNGCRTRATQPVLYAHQDLPPVGTLCRYHVSGWLERSERLSPRDLASAREAFVAAPDHPGLDHCIPPGGWMVVVRTAPEEIAEIAFGTECGDGVSMSSVPEGPSGEGFGRLTPDVMHWVLSPGWAQVMRRPVPWPVGNFR